MGGFMVNLKAPSNHITAKIDLGLSQTGSRVVVAMSGGVDSSVVAALVHEAGYQAIGLTMQLYDQGEMALKKKACCAGIDIYDARSVADQLGMAHYVLDYESRFKQAVMEDFADSYLAGETPIPCIRCNQTVKFQDMFTRAKELGAEALATGHYVRRLPGAFGPELHQAVDANRDQSYFLFTTTCAQLDFLRFPLGHMGKDETRNHARRFDLTVHDKPDSQDICFVPNGNYAQIVERLRPGALEPGEIWHQNGQKLGDHDGIIQFTVGQRKGLKIASPDGLPLYVVEIDPKAHRIVVGPKAALARTKVFVKEVNWLGYPQEYQEHHDIHIKVRSSQTPIAAIVQLSDDGCAEVILKAPEYGISHGQACVFYQGTRVLGGGWICGSA